MGIIFMEGIIMDGATHLVVGALAGQLAGRDPASQFAAGVVSHLVADSLPHWDPDPLKGEALPYFLWGFQALSLIRRMDEKGARGALLGALGGLAPDIEHVLFHMKLIPAKIFPTHVGPEYEPYFQIQIPKKMGFPLLVLTNLISLGLLSRRSRRKRKHGLLFRR